MRTCNDCGGELGESWVEYEPNGSSETWARCEQCGHHALLAFSAKETLGWVEP